MKLILFLILLAAVLILFFFVYRKKTPDRVTKDVYICPVCNSLDCECQKENREEL